MSARRRLEVIIAGDSSGSKKALGETEGALGKFKKMAGAAIKAVAAGGLALGAALGAAAFKTARHADEMIKSARTAGIGVEAYQELEYALGQAGIEQDMFNRLLQRNTQRLGRAVEGNEKYASAYADLGVEITDTNGQMRDSEAVFDDVLTSLAAIEDPAIRAAKAGELLGTNAGRKLAGALDGGIESIDEARERAQELGIVLSEDSALAAEKFNDQWDDIKRSMQGFMHQAGIPVMGFLSDQLFPFVLDTAVPALRTFGQWIGPKLTAAFQSVAGPLGDLVSGLRGGFVEGLDDGTSTVMRFGQLVGSTFGDLWDVFKEGDGVVDGLIGVFESLAGRLGDGAFFETIIDAARTAFANLVDWLADSGITTILNTILAARERLLDAAMRLFPAIVDAAVAFLPELVNWITGHLIPTVVDFVAGAVPQLLDAALTLFATLADAVTTVLPDLLGTLAGDVLPALLDEVVGMLPDLLDAGIELFNALLDAVLDVLPDLLGVLLGDVLPALIETLLGMVPDLVDGAITLFMALLDGVLTVLPELITVLATVVLPALITAIIKMAPQLLMAAVETFFALFTALDDIGRQLVEFIIFDLAPTLGDAFMSIDLLEIGKEIIRGLWTGISSMGTWLADKISGWVADKVPGPIAKALGIGSPSRVAADLARSVPEGMAEGLTDRRRLRELERAAEQLSSAALTELRTPTVDLAATSSRRTDGGADRRPRPVPDQVTVEQHFNGQDPRVAARESADELVWALGGL